MPIQKGGVEQHAVIVGTHNYRLQCFFNKNNFGNPLYTQKNFKNCAIIKCSKLGKYVKFTMIWEGQLSKEEQDEEDERKDDKKKYWTMETFNREGVIKNQKIYIEPNVNVYLVRHGQGVHNVKIFKKIVSVFKLYDAKLSDEGVKQAINAGSYLFGYEFKDYNSQTLKVHYVASHLQRTQQTIANLARSLYNKFPQNIININPCANELAVVENGMCNSSHDPKTVLAEMALENKASCIHRGLHDEILIKKDCLSIKNINNNEFLIDWNYYRSFDASKLSCEDTNIVTQSLYAYRYGKYSLRSLENRDKLDIKFTPNEFKAFNSMTNTLIRNSEGKYYPISKILYSKSGKPADFVLIKSEITSGKQGTIYDACSGTNCNYILKKMNGNAAFESKFIQEIRFHNIAAELNVTDPIVLAYSMELENGNYEYGYVLKKYNKTLFDVFNSEKYETEFKKKILRNCIYILEILSSKDYKICHVDSHILNFMIDEQNEVKIIDFGLARPINTDEDIIFCVQSQLELFRNNFDRMIPSLVKDKSIILAELDEYIENLKYSEEEEYYGDEEATPLIY